jgi:hypothetical protein
MIFVLSGMGTNVPIGLDMNHQSLDFIDYYLR